MTALARAGSRPEVVMWAAVFLFFWASGLLSATHVLPHAAPPGLLALAGMAIAVAGVARAARR